MSKRRPPSSRGRRRASRSSSSAAKAPVSSPIPGERTSMPRSRMRAGDLARRLERDDGRLPARAVEPPQQLPERELGAADAARGDEVEHPRHRWCDCSGFLDRTVGLPPTIAAFLTGNVAHSEPLTIPDDTCRWVTSTTCDRRIMNISWKTALAGAAAVAALGGGRVAGAAHGGRAARDHVRRRRCAPSAGPPPGGSSRRTRRAACASCAPGSARARSPRRCSPRTSPAAGRTGAR